MRKKESVSCPHCEHNNVKKNGHNNGAQRYLCNNCKKTFIKNADKKRIKYNSKEKAFLSMLLDFLQPISNENNSFKQIIKNLDEAYSDSSQFRFEQVELSNKTNEIQCYQPKVLICKENNTVTIYHFGIRHSSISSHREIKIIDDDFNAKNKTVQKTKNFSPHEKYKSKLKVQRSLVSEEEMIELGLYDEKYDENFYQNDLDEY